MKNVFIAIKQMLKLELVFTRNICGFSSIILLQTRQKYAGGLSPGKYFSRRMQQNLPKRHVYTLVKTGSYIFLEFFNTCIIAVTIFAYCCLDICCFI